MATFTELYDLRSNGDLKNKVAVALVIKATAVLEAAASAAQVAWAKSVFTNPDAMAGDILNYVLAKNAAQTRQAISAASDAAIQIHVNTAVDKLLTGV